jgi:outer membrane lipoprotein-sorting protein
LSLATSVATSALALPASSLRLPAQADSLFDRAVRAYATARTIRATFEQTLTNPALHETRRSRGAFAQQGASRFAFRFTHPPGEAIVSDGNFLWLYLPSAVPKQVLKLPVALGANLDFLTQLLTNPRESYAVAVGGTATLDGQPVADFTLTPRGSGTPFTSATLWIATRDLLVRQVEVVEPGGLVRRVRFSSIRAGGELPTDALTFTVPPGVRVVDQAALLGGRPDDSDG